MMVDTLEIFGVEYANVNGFQAQDENGNWITYVRPTGTLTVNDNGTFDCSLYDSVTVSIPSATGVSF